MTTISAPRTATRMWPPNPFSWWPVVIALLVIAAAFYF